MEREIIKIDEELCNGCGLCVPNCHEGALQIIDGKVRLISDLMCDGLGACIGHCPEGAIEIEKREAEPYDEISVIKEMINKGENTVVAHLTHLKEHGETGFLDEGINWLKSNKALLDFDLEETLNKIKTPVMKEEINGCGCGDSTDNQHKHNHEQHRFEGCPGSKEMVIEREPDAGLDSHQEEQRSELAQWPVQLHLINPSASYFAGSDLLIAADCTAFSMGNFHSEHLKGKSLVIACPKLDQGTETYIQKFTALIDNAGVNTITVMMMEVPCCTGLLQMVNTAQSNASRKVPVKMMIVSTSGAILREEWV